MFPSNFFNDFLLTAQSVKTDAAREVGNRLLLGALELSNVGKNRVTTAALMNHTGITKPQFYYFTNGMSGIWSLILKAALFRHDTLTPSQRIKIVEAALRLDVPVDMPFTSAVTYLVDKQFPMRRVGWSVGYVVNHNDCLMYCEKGREGMREWNATSEDMLSEDWRIALPYKTLPPAEN